MRAPFRPLPWLAAGAAAAAGALVSSPAAYTRVRRALRLEGPSEPPAVAAAPAAEAPVVDAVQPERPPAIETADTQAMREQIDAVRARLHARAEDAKPDAPAP